MIHRKIHSFIFVLMICFFAVLQAAPTYVEPLPDLGHVQAGDQTNYPKDSDIEQTFQQYQNTHHKKMLNEGVSYQQPWGAFSKKQNRPKDHVKAVKERVSAKSKENIQKNPVKMDTRSLDQLGEAYGDVYKTSFSSTTHEIQKIVSSAQKSQSKPLLSQMETQKTASKDNGTAVPDSFSSGVQSLENSVSKKKKPNLENGMDVKSIHQSKNRILPGYTYFAVLVSQINTDYPGPILAKIVNGNLKGASLLGTFKRQVDKIAIKFNSMNYKGQIYSINAIAMDPAKYRTALADSVDHHYLKRYGLYFSASFLDGYAKGLVSGTTTATSGSVVSTQDQLSPAGRIAYAFGNVGKKILPIWEQAINQPPTVRLNQGRGLGVMFMSTVVLKINHEQTSQPQWLTELGDA